MQYWDYERDDVSGVNFTGHSDLISANFRFAQAEGAIFDGTDLRGADFSGASLAGAQFLDSDLRDVSFVGADLENVTIAYCTWRGEETLRSANHKNTVHLKENHIVTSFEDSVEEQQRNRREPKPLTPDQQFATHRSKPRHENKRGFF